MRSFLRLVFLLVPLSIFMVSGAGLMWIERERRPLSPTEYYRVK